jgi:cell wall-associated NlpC family hydrolase
VSALPIGAVAYTYNRTTAANWADAHSIGGGTCGVYHVYACMDNDCTAFVSAALNQGGLDLVYHGYPNFEEGYVDDSDTWFMNWSSIPNGYAWSLQFTVANKFRKFMADHNRGSGVANVAGTTLATSAPGGLTKGDVILFDWTSDGHHDHMAILVGSGTSTDGYSGQYVDAHTNNRYHAFWTLRTWNQHIQTTTLRSFEMADSGVNLS